MKPARRTYILVAIFLVLALALPILAITTVPAKVVCPVCGTMNEFLDYASWGSYIYQYPSKFQLVFWPHTWSASVYSCKKCHLSLFMWDFKDFPKDKIDSTKALLDGVTLSGDYKKYTDIPVSEKLLIAEKVYKNLNRDDDFWCHFYRVLGYHFTQENKPEQAKEARLRALEIALRMMRDVANEGRRKELLVLAASMHHFTGDDAAAVKELDNAAPLVFRDPKGDEKRSKNYDAYLTELINEFVPAIEQKKVPDGFDR